MFIPGQFCECIRDNWGADQWGQPSAWPKKGSVYRVRDVMLDPIEKSETMLLLSEITGGIHTTIGFERGFDARAFRPLQDSAIEVFRALLVDLPALPKFEPAKEKVS